MSRLIRIYTVCHSVLIDFGLRSLFVSMVLTRFIDGRVHFRNSGDVRVKKDNMHPKHFINLSKLQEAGCTQKM